MQSESVPALDGQEHDLDIPTKPSKLTIAGCVLTTGWLIFFGFIICLRWERVEELKLNELGDFFAGFFAPLAFLWLVLGFAQQGRELRLSSEALRMQVRELNASVQQQREMVRVAELSHRTETAAYRDQRRRERATADPHFVFSENRDGGHYALDGTGIAVGITLRNDGGTVSNLHFSYTGELPSRPIEHLLALPKGHEQSLLFVIPESGLDEFTLSISYFDFYQKQGVRNFKVGVLRKPIRLTFHRIPDAPELAAEEGA